MSFKDFNADTKKIVSSNLNQVIDVIQEDMSGSMTRRKYQTFVTGGIGPGVTSSLYQTVYDQDFTLQTANPVCDMTIGLFHSDDGTTQRKNLVTLGTGYQLSSTTGQTLFSAKSTMMMREKISIYRQYANYLLGDPDAAFILDGTSFPSSKAKADFNVASDVTVIDAALFVNVKRLFSRDGIRKETFAMRLYRHTPIWDSHGTPASRLTPGGSANSSVTPSGVWVYPYYVDNGVLKWQNAGGTGGHAGTPTVMAIGTTSATHLPQENLFGGASLSSPYGVQIVADLGSAQDYKEENAAGDVALIKLASDSTKAVGLLFYQAGIAVLNLGSSSVAAGLNDGTSAGKEIDLGLGHLMSGSIETIFDPRDFVVGKVAGMSNSSSPHEATTARVSTAAAGELLIGGRGGGTYGGADARDNDTANGEAQVASRGEYKLSTSVNGVATFYPDLLVSASIDDIVDHIGFTRFSSGSLTAMAFQNQTKINSSIYFCRASASEFNTSANPTFLDSSGVPVMIQDATNDKPFTYITTVALADSQGDVVAIAKLNRPIEKNDESEVTIRVRLDF
tara:strand:- start:625 stop:2313 length:1689 start_codon:yes stop_codon:yes gene_type:complete